MPRTPRTTGEAVARPCVYVQAEKLLKQSSRNDAQLVDVWNKIGDYHADRQKWHKVFTLKPHCHPWFDLVPFLMRTPKLSHALVVHVLCDQG